MTVKCGIVHLKTADETTSVRTDSSASRSAAEEIINQAKILVPADVAIKKGDYFKVHGIELRAFKVEPRIAVTGRLDHYEVDFEHWPE